MYRFGEKLRNLRTDRQLTLQQLAAALGYKTHAYISEIEGGKKAPTVAFVLKVADLFQVTTDELLRDKLDLPPPSDRTAV
jgi:transcriptional regulator with XRE-family HTH domain